MRDVVETAQGRVRGTERKGVVRFAGIPFARAPEGRLRFAPPEPAEPWPGVRDASERGASAPQSAPQVPLMRVVGAGASQGEDCLFVNVWTPNPDPEAGKRPVLVWVHGGAFVMGSGSSPIYNGRRLARRHDVVVVTIHYRLGALGFLHLAELGDPAYSASSNLGIRDQIAALQWVQENIAAFGGDPDNVTVFGESAGGMSVGTLLGVPAARPLFHRAILQSGAAHNVSGRERAARTVEIFLRQLGLRVDQLERLRELPSEEVVRAQQRTALELGFNAGALPWQPAVDGDVLPEQPLDAIARGDAAGIPVLIGTNRDEWKLFTLFDRRTQKLDADTLRRWLARAMPGKEDDGSEHADRALEIYRRARAGRGRAHPGELWAAIQADRVFRYPAMRLAELHARHEPDTYAYLFEWAPRVARRRVGACHGIEIPFVFGTLRNPWLRPLFATSRSAKPLSRTMQEAWCRFAETGRPDAAGLDAWSPYRADDRATLMLGAHPALEHAPLEPERAFWEPLLADPGD